MFDKPWSLRRREHRSRLCRAKRNPVRHTSVQTETDEALPVLPPVRWVDTCSGARDPPASDGGRGGRRGSFPPREVAAGGHSLQHLNDMSRPLQQQGPAGTPAAAAVTHELPSTTVHGSLALSDLRDSSLHVGEASR